MARSFKGIFFVLMLPLAAFGQQSSFTLAQAQDYGAQNNVDAQKSALNVESARNTVDERIATGLPQLSGSVDYNYFAVLPTSLIPAEFFGGEPGTFVPLQFGTKQNLTAGLSFSQLLFNGSWLAGVSAAKTYVELTQSQQKLSDREVRQNIELAYYAVLVSGEQEKILQKNIDNLTKTLHEVSEMNKQGFVEEIDVDRLQISLANLQTQLQNVQRQTALAKNNLKFQMGYDLSKDIMLLDSIGSLTEDIVVADNDQHYLSRPEFDILNTTIILNQDNVKVNRAGYLPTLSLIGSFQENAQRNKFDFFDTDQPWFETALIGFSLQVPIFDGLQKKNTIQNARIGLEQAQLDQQKATQGIMLEIDKAKTDYLNAKNDVDNQMSNTGLAQKIYDVALEKYKQGVGSSLELTEAESSLYQAQGAYIGALYNLLNAQSKLKKALGY